MSEIMDRTALIVELLGHVVSLRDHDDDCDTEMINAWEAAADVMERAADALTEQDATIEAAKAEFRSSTYGAFWKSRAQAMYAAISGTEGTR